jgi:hypothetical protein
MMMRRTRCQSKQENTEQYTSIVLNHDIAEPRFSRSSSSTALWNMARDSTGLGSIRLRNQRALKVYAGHFLFRRVRGRPEFYLSITSVICRSVGMFFDLPVKFRSVPLVECFSSNA